QLDVWARLLDNKLPEGAVGTRNLPEASVSRVGAGVMDPLTLAVAGAIAQSGDGPQGQEQDGERGEQAPITLTWTGPLSVLPIAGPAPRELADGNHLSMQFTASRTGQVQFRDDELG